MGIRGLGKFLKWKAPRARSGIHWPAHRGTRWGIDISCLLYRAQGAGLSQLTVVASLIYRMRLAGVQPIVVFDGKPPAAKAEVIEQRRTVRVAAQKEITVLQTQLTEPKTERERAEIQTRVADLQKKAPVVTGSDRNDIKKMFYSMGVQFLTANGEADDLLAYLARMGVIDGVVSTDMDMLARGVPLLVVPETPDCTVLTEIALSVLLGELGLTYEQFVVACQLMGSDYTPAGCKTVEPREAVAAAAGGIVLAEEMAKGAALLAGVGVTWESLTTEKQREKWNAGPPPVEIDALVTLASKEGWPQEWIYVLGSAR